MKPDPVPETAARERARARLLERLRGQEPVTGHDIVADTNGNVPVSPVI